VKGLDGSSTLLSGIEILLLVLLSSIFSASEVAFIGSSEIKLRKLMDEGNEKAKKILKLRDKPEKLISTIIVGNNFVNIFAASLSTVLFINLFKERGYLYSSIIMTLIIVLFGEMIPKTLASYYPESLSIKLYPLYTFFSYVLYPFSFILSKINDGIMMIFGKKLKKSVTVGEEEFRILLSLSREKGTIDEYEKEMIEGVFELQDKPVYEVMTPRVDMVALPLNASKEEIAECFAKTGYSRIPIYNGSIDNIVGILHVKDFLKIVLKGDDGIRDHLHKPAFVPDTKKIGELFREMRKKKIQMAIVIDEFGGVEGLVTMEDIIEEIVGEIQDEYDIEEVLYRKIGPDTYVFDAKIPIEDVEKVINEKLPKEEYETLSGLFLDLIGHIPQNGESVTYNSLKFTAIDVRGNRIMKIKIEKGKGNEEGKDKTSNRRS